MNKFTDRSRFENTLKLNNENYDDMWEIGQLCFN